MYKSNIACKSNCSENTQKSNVCQFFLQCCGLQNSNFNENGLHTNDLLENFDGNPCNVQLFKVIRKKKTTRNVLTSLNLTENRRVLYQFPGIFQKTLAKSPCECKQLKSDQIPASVNGLKTLKDRKNSLKFLLSRWDVKF